MPRHRLRDAVWASLHAKLGAIPGIWKSDSERLRRCVEAVVYALRTGVAWEDLPDRFGKPNSLYRRFRRWSLHGIWDALFASGIPEDGIEVVIPSKRNRKTPIPHDRSRYRTRHQIDNLFCRVKDYTRIALRKDKTSRSCAGFVSLAFALINIQVCP